MVKVKEDIYYYKIFRFIFIMTKTVDDFQLINTNSFLKKKWEGGISSRHHTQSSDVVLLLSSLINVGSQTHFHITVA